MSSGSKRKGDKFENDVCLALTEWVTGVRVSRISESIFRKRSTAIVPAEGHWHGHGDILHRPQYDWWPFAIECKDREEWRELDGMFNQTSWPVWDYWKTALDHADKAGDLYPMLIFSRKRRKPLVMVESSLESLLTPPKRTRLHPILRVAGRAEYQSVILMPLEEMTKVPISRVKRLRRRGGA